MGGISGEGTVYSASDHEITPIRWVVLVEKELLTLPMIMRSPPCLVGFVLSLCSFSFWYPSNYSFRLHCAIFKRLFNACSLEICKFQYHTVKWGELDIIKFVSNKNVDICNLWKVSAGFFSLLSWATPTNWQWGPGVNETFQSN